MRERADGRRRRLLIRSLVLLGVLVSGWVLGRLGSTTTRPAADRSGPALTPAATTRAGIPVGFSDTAKGAAAAVAAYQRAFASPSIQSRWPLELETAVMRAAG